LVFTCSKQNTMHALYFVVLCLSCLIFSNLFFIMKYLFYLTIATVLFFTRCQFNNYSYVQTPLNVPSLKARGELSASASVNVRSINALVSYSPVKHVGVMGTLNKGFAGNVEALEGGAGLYLPAGKMLFTTYAGMGIGTVNIKGRYITWFNGNFHEWNNQSQYTKLFIQPAIERSFGKKFTVGIAARFTEVNFNSYASRYEEAIHSHDKHGVAYSSDNIDSFAIGKPSAISIFEPTVLFSITPMKRFSFQCQLGYSFVKWHGDFLEKQQGHLPLQPVFPFDYFFSNASSQSTNARANPIFVPFSINGTVSFNISTRKNKSNP
jgi:hypothetical protein